MSGSNTGQPLLGRGATGHELSASAMFIYRLEHGRIAEAWQMIDDWRSFAWLDSSADGPGESVPSRPRHVDGFFATWCGSRRCVHRGGPGGGSRSVYVAQINDKGDMMSSRQSYFDVYENFALSRSAHCVLTVRFHTNNGPITFTGTTHSQCSRLLEDIAFDRDNQIMVLTGTGDSFMDTIDGPSLGDLTKPMAADVDYMEGRRIVQRWSTSRCRSSQP